MNLPKSIFNALLISLALFSFAQADELMIPVGTQGGEKASLDRPKVGMKADAVEAKFGAPLKKSTPIGKPPISSWEYPYYNVYFESDRVIHTVMKPYSEDVPASVPAVVAPVAPATEAAPAAVVDQTTVDQTTSDPAVADPAVEAEPAPATAAEAAPDIK